ncbi:hypothetical protein MBLNU459_g0257t1 [Dothideomycetes sp. NU459]
MIMRPTAFTSVSICACLVTSTAVTSRTLSAFDNAKFGPFDIITRDVAIIGGGSAGTYSAISLKDKGKSIIVIEKKERLGGHTETYIDPATSMPIDMGVEIWHNISVVTNYFKRLHIPLTKSVFYTAAPFSYDLRSGKQVNRSSTPSTEEETGAFAAYLAQLSRYPELSNGTFLPSPVPEDLYLPFGKFLEKYNLQAALPSMYNFNWGVGNILANPTVEQMRYWGSDMVQSLSTGFLTTAHHNSSELYTKAAAELSADSSVLLSSEVVDAARGNGQAGIKLIVRTPEGNKLVIANKLLIAIPPKLDFLLPLDLSDQEKDVFGKYIDAGYYVAIVNNTGFPDNTSVSNAAQDSAYNLPPLPGVYSISPAGQPGLQMVFSGTPQSNASFPMSDSTVKADMIRSIKALQAQNPANFRQAQPTIVDYKSHAPYYLQVSSEDIKNGFYDDLYALQGLRNTYWTGAAWRVHDSSEIWKYSEEQVLPNLLASL